ncbi:MAG: S1C family serine protease [Halobaculum sp.]
MPRRRRILRAAGAAGLAGLAGCAETLRVETEGGVATPSEARDTPPRETASGSDPTSDFGEVATEVYRDTIPSVATILLYDAGGRAGSGSGFVTRVNGRRVVVTNQHVVDPGSRFQIQFHRNEWRSAEVVGTDAYSDLAILAPESFPEFAEPLDMVRTDPEPPVGTDVLAIGSPFGLGGSASSGVISGVDRLLPAPNEFLIADAVQTDAALNPGNSGGPLVTDDGRVAAVVNSAGAENIGFGISAELSKRVLPALADDGSYRHSFMGVRLTEVTPSIAQAYDLDEVAGIVVVDVLDGGPSDGALQPADGTTEVGGVEVETGGDVIRRLNDTRVETQAALSKYLALETSPGDELDVTVLRDGSRVTETITLGTRPQP